MRISFLVLFSWLLLFNTFAQDEAALSIKEETALENILKLSIDVSICDKKENSIWDLNSSKLTIPGRPVTMKLEGKSIRITGSFTPYYQGKDLMILAQAQVYLSPPLVSKTQYFSSFKTLPIMKGESLHYYPLGQGGEMNLEKDQTKDEDEAIEGQMVPEKAPIPLGNEEKEEDKKASMYYILIKLELLPYVKDSADILEEE